MGDVSVPMWLVVSVLTVVAPSVAVGPLVVGDVKGWTGRGEETILLPLIAYVYGFPVSIVLGLASGVAFYMSGVSFVEGYVVGPIMIVVLGWSLFAIGFVRFVILGHDIPTAP